MGLYLQRKPSLTKADGAHFYKGNPSPDESFKFQWILAIWGLTIKEQLIFWRGADMTWVWKVRTPWETIGWLEFRFSNNKWSAGYPKWQISSDHRSRAGYRGFSWWTIEANIHNIQVHSGRGKMICLFSYYWVLGQVTDTIWYQIKGNKMMPPWGNKGNTFCKNT